MKTRTTNTLKVDGAATAALARKTIALALWLAVWLLGLGSSAAAQTITTFDAPGAGTSSGQGTFGEGINPAGAITGFYLDADFIQHGFLRIP